MVHSFSQNSLALRKILGKLLTSVFQQGLRNVFLENCFLVNSASNLWPQKSPW